MRYLIADIQKVNNLKGYKVEVLIEKIILLLAIESGVNENLYPDFNRKIKRLIKQYGLRNSRH